MKTFALSFSLLSALVLVPTGVFAHDKRKDYNATALEQIYADRLAHGYQANGQPMPTVDHCAPRFISRAWDVRDYDRDTDSGYAPRCHDDRRAGFWTRSR